MLNKSLVYNSDHLLLYKETKHTDNITSLMTIIVIVTKPGTDTSESNATDSEPSMKVGL